MCLTAGSQTAIALECWERLEEREDGVFCEIDGQSLHIADVVAAARHDGLPELVIPESVVNNLQSSVDVLAGHLAKGWYVYGVNTGFGGSADTRTDQMVALQAALMQLTQAGVLSPGDRGLATGTPVDISNAMPAAWVRAMMLVRINSNVRGHSAVTAKTLQAVVRLFKEGITPVVPLRGSISASGDLMPLSYVVGAMEGNPDIFVQLQIDGQRQTVSSRYALALRDIEPVGLGPKEGLGLINGTSASAALGSIVLYRVHQQSVLTQALTAMAVEALDGTAESFHPFIAQIRPHPGQKEAAQNIYAFLSGSQLARTGGKHSRAVNEDLAQDRYSLRTASQWIGPQLEDIALAHHQITTELNSTTDNPLVDVTGEGAIFCGGNFQASSVTTAVEKARLSMQMYGRLLFTQLQEMVDPTMSNGLPANLASDDPSLSFTCKGVDIAMASYMAELAYLAQPLSSYVQVAEMHNQAVNSMAFASARYSMQAADLLNLMCANHLYACCQAVDLRVLHMLFIEKVQSKIIELAVSRFFISMEGGSIGQLILSFHTQMCFSWKTSSKLDFKDRCAKMIASLMPRLVEQLAKEPEVTLRVLDDFRHEATTKAFKIWTEAHTEFCRTQPTAEYLGSAGGALYSFVRGELQVPFHQGFVEHPQGSSTTPNGRLKKTIGNWISDIHAAICVGRLDAVVMKLVRSQLIETRDSAASQQGQDRSSQLAT
ncbi:hypothetical protein BAUCODRAFT_361906 [Baudoinia panamericana UAMH 10762]|uniref:Phenylalanine ammonia-lyase n=1 Tax=Baudoinia panamericana (strain UAMH 10762) TaxID=717646 RepID=M2MT64_BAUPA|nr:uncharacterized protein BAUCODRAFT_361906 [Baudoinia panamericana UAMH 10762]EMD00062.1 hypothetical protein BAUCODRAFT_361906 [Baudoinia panamericana UAMH 10762]